jgi:hypothetical protein
MHRWIGSRTHTAKCSHRGLDDEAWGVAFSSMAMSPGLAGLQPGGLVTHEDTPIFLYFHTFWLYLSVAIPQTYCVVS